MKRDHLRSVIADACDDAGVNDEEREALVGTADNIDRVAFESYAFQPTDGGEMCGCPATLAGFYDPITGWSDDSSVQVHRFPGFFDGAMYRLRINEEIQVEEIEALSPDPAYVDEEPCTYVAVRIED